MGDTAKVLLGLLLPLAGTVLGSATVFFFKKQMGAKVQKALLGFASGVMIAASVWSLLIPAIEMAEASGGHAYLPAVVGFLLGMGFLLLLDTLIPHLHLGEDKPEGRPAGLGKSFMLVLAVTLHNIPEGMAVGLSFALAAQGGAANTFAAAVALAIGIGLQNFPEGAAISLPLKKEGLSNTRSFIYGALSGIVEPIGGILTVLIAGSVSPVMPWLLAFAAGAMIYVVVEELIPEAHLGEHSHVGTIGVMFGFLVMMILDVALG